MIAVQDSLIETIRRARESVGAELSDYELTDLVHARGELAEDGFTFLRVSKGFALFSVPRQNASKWYGQNVWLSPEKEKQAREIAKRYGLKICEPPDHNILSVPDHHHFDFYRDEGKTFQRTVVIAHPEFLKIRVTSQPLPLEHHLLGDLASLYE
jgi:hypothetical protein